MDGYLRNSGETTELSRDLPVRRETILEEAGRLVAEHAASDYGHPSRNFKDIAKLWSVIFGWNVTGYEVGLCMIALKLARLANRRKRDSLVDIAGYARTLEMLDTEPSWPKPPRYHENIRNTS